MLATRFMGHLVITATLFLPKRKIGQLFSYVKNPSKTAAPFMRPPFWYGHPPVDTVSLSGTAAR